MLKNPTWFLTIGSGLIRAQNQSPDNWKRWAFSRRDGHGNEKPQSHTSLMNLPRPPPVPGLIRRPVGPSPLPPDPPRVSSSSSDGVVVVGFLSRRPDDSSQLINQLLDSSAFGSGNMDKILPVDDKSDVQDWFRLRRISYYYAEEKGIVFVQFCPAFESDSEFGDLQGLLFMFSVSSFILS